MFQLIDDTPKHEPWNKGRLIGQKKPLKPKEIWAIRIRLQMAGAVRDLALLNLAIDSKLRGCDFVRLRVSDVAQAGRVQSRAPVTQRKTQQPVQFEITEETQKSTAAWIKAGELGPGDYLFPSRIHGSPHLSTRQYARIANNWVDSVGLDPAAYGKSERRKRPFKYGRCPGGLGHKQTVSFLNSFPGDIHPLKVAQEAGP